MSTFYLKSFGCKVNQYDGQGLRERLLALGHEETSHPEEADLLVLNFCVVTGRSASRCHRALSSTARRRPGARVVAAGCLTPEDRDRVRSACPEAVILSEGAPEGLDIPPVRSGAPGDEGCWETVNGLEGHTRAFLKVQDGCNIRCTYCVIPSIRGDERSRPPDDVIDEARRLLDQGYRELVLCGIRLGGYRFSGLRLDGLLRELLAALEGDEFRIRLSSLNPAEVTPNLIEAMKGDRRVARHLHLPLQSGDKGVLKAMGRPYSPELYLRKAAALREALESPALSTDLIVGFPGEDEPAFERSLKTLEAARIARVHVFPYSPRAGTPAASLPPVPDGVKTERARRARDRAAVLKTEFDRDFLGRKARVLVERGGWDRDVPEGLTGRYQKVRFPDAAGRIEPDRFVSCRLDSYDEGVFTGVPLHEEDRP